MKTTKIALLAFSVSLVARAGSSIADNKKPAKIYPTPPGKSGTPPGLAKKPGGMPPGQYKKIYRKGETLPSGYKWITDYDLWRLPALAPGQGYARYDNEVYRVARDTAVVIEAIGIVSDLMR